MIFRGVFVAFGVFIFYSEIFPSRPVLQAKAAAYTKGLQQGAGIGMGTALLLFALMFGIKRLTRRLTVTKKPQARAATI